MRRGTGGLEGEEERQASRKREQCDRDTTWLCVFTSHAQPGVAGAAGARIRPGRKTSSLHHREA